MDLTKDSFIPLYYQLAERLREKISAKVYGPGEPIPSESELMQQYRISRGTVRQALQKLFQEGLIERYAGKGSFVAYPKIEQNASTEIGFFTQTILGAGKVPSAKIIEVNEFKADHSLHVKLQLKDDMNVVLVKRLRFADNEPLAIESQHFRGDIGRKLIDEDLRGSIYKILQEKYHYILYRSVNSIEVSLASEQIAKLLNTNGGRPVLLIKRLVYLSDNKPFEYSEDIYRADRIRFSIKDLYKTDKTKIEIATKTVHHDSPLLI